MNIKSRFIRLFLIINKKLKLRSSKDKTEASICSMEDVSSEEEYLSNFTYENNSQMKTSTPMKKLPIKIIMIQEVSNLKIYEDFDDLDMMNNNNENEDLNISDVTVYENLKHLQNNNFDYKYIPYIDESSGFKIYEDIGESFVVE